MSKSSGKLKEIDTSGKLKEIDTSGKLKEIDTINYLCNIISVTIKKPYSIVDFCKKWYDEHLKEDFHTPEEAFYQFFCDTTDSGYAMYIPDIPVLASHHENTFKKESDENIPVNWDCENCTDCKWCVKCKECKNCKNSVECISCTDCNKCRKCTYVDFAYDCRYVYHSCFVINKTNRANLEGSCDDNCNWNCKNCTNCTCCVDCSNCVDCHFAENCNQCTQLNDVFKKYIDKIIANNPSTISKTRRMFKMYILLSRLGMLSNNCSKCTHCDYLHNGNAESNIMGDNDIDNMIYIDKYMSTLCDKVNKHTTVTNST